MLQPFTLSTSRGRGRASTGSGHGTASGTAATTTTMTAHTEASTPPASTAGDWSSHVDPAGPAPQPQHQEVCSAVWARVGSGGHAWEVVTRGKRWARVGTRG